MMGGMAGGFVGAGGGAAGPDAWGLIEKSWARTHVVGHRGAAASVPENTIPSFLKSVEVGAHATECDIHMSKDGVAVVMHDTTLDRTTSLRGKVADFTMAEMAAAGIPSLDDYIRALKGKIVQVLEIKAGEQVVEAVVADVREHGTEKESIIFSFNGEFVKRAKELAPEIPAVWLVARRYDEADFGTLLDLKSQYRADALGFQFRNVHPALAAKLRGEKIPLFVWTVPPGAEIERLRDLRVNFIITDHPQEVLGMLGF